MAVLPGRAVEAGDDERLDDGRVGLRDGRVLTRERLGPQIGAGDREREALAVDDAEPVFVRMAAVSASTPSGVLAPTSRTSNASASSGRTSAPAGRSTRRWIGSMHSSSSASSTTKVMIAAAPSPARRLGACARSSLR